VSEKCGAPNDKLLEDGISTEVYHCDLDLGHTGPHKSLGHPAWVDFGEFGTRTVYKSTEPLVTKTGKVLTDADIEALADEAEAGYDVEHLKGKPNRPDLATRALQAMLPPDAKDCALVLDVMARKEKGWLVTDLERAAVRRAVEILRGEP